MTNAEGLTELPLRTPVFHILLALSRCDLHGLGIAEEVERATGGTVELGPGTLYRSLKEMSGVGLVRDVPGPAEADPRRRYYSVTPEGRKVLHAEAARLARLVEVARERDVLPDPA